MIYIAPKINDNTNFRANPIAEATSKAKIYEDMRKAMTPVVLSSEEPILPKDDLALAVKTEITYTKLERFLRKYPILKSYADMLSKKRDNAFNDGKLPVINEKYDDKERLREIQYKYGAYKRFVYLSDSPTQLHAHKKDDGTYVLLYRDMRKNYHFKPNYSYMTISEERLPSGITRYYTCQIITDNDTLYCYIGLKSLLNKMVLPNGTTYIYSYYPNGNLKEMTCSNGSKNTYYSNRKLMEEILSDGTKRAYYENGNLKEEILTDGSKKTYFSNGHLKQEFDPNGTVINSNLV